MKYGNVTESEYHSGIDAIKWTLQQKRAQLESAEFCVQDIKNEIEKIEADMRGILSVIP